MFLDALALAEKQELCEPHLIDLACQLLACTRQSLGNASDQLRRPLEVISVAMPGFQRAEQCVIVQPMPMGVAELLINRL